MSQDLDSFEDRSVDLENLVMQKYQAIAQLHGGPEVVYVGTVCTKRVNFRDGMLYIKITFPEAVKGRQEVDGYARSDDTRVLTALSGILHYGTIVVLDRATGELIEVVSNY